MRHLACAGHPDEVYEVYGCQTHPPAAFALHAPHPGAAGASVDMVSTPDEHVPAADARARAAAHSVHDDHAPGVPYGVQQADAAHASADHAANVHAHASRTHYTHARAAETAHGRPASAAGHDTLHSRAHLDPALGLGLHVAAHSLDVGSAARAADVHGGGDCVVEVDVGRDVDVAAGGFVNWVAARGSWTRGDGECGELDPSPLRLMELPIGVLVIACCFCRAVVEQLCPLAVRPPRVSEDNRG